MLPRPGGKACKICHTPACWWFAGWENEDVCSPECITLRDIWEVFEKYREHLGLASSLDEQCEFEDKFCAVFCDRLGHEFGPDQCGIPEHDLCSRCERLASDLGYVRRDAGVYLKRA